MGPNKKDINFKLNVIVMTFRRNDELFRCLHSLLAARNACHYNFILHISIFDNDPDNDISKSVNFLNREENYTINYIKRHTNIGPRRNFISSLIESHQKIKPDGHIYVSDDDYVLPEFFSKYIECFLRGNDAIISSCFVRDDSVSDEYSYVKHRTRRVPTRPYVGDQNIKQFITDSRLLTGTAYSDSLLDRVLNFSKLTPSFIETLWYPMAFLSSFSKYPCFISQPIFVHTQNNRTHWGKFDAYQEFFLERIQMFEKMSDLGLVSKAEVDDLIIDFIGHQNLERILKYLSSIRPSLYFCLRIAYVSIFRKYIFERVPNLIASIARKLVFHLNAFRKI